MHEAKSNDYGRGGQANFAHKLWGKVKKALMIFVPVNNIWLLK